VIQRPGLLLSKVGIEQGGHVYRGTNQRPGLVDMQVFQLYQIEGFTRRLQVDGLSAGHASGAAGAGQGLQHSQARLCIGLHGFTAAEGLEGEGLQGIPHQNGSGLVIGLVAGGLVASEIVVIHRRQVVMHQGVGVDQLDGGCRAVESLWLDANRLACGIDQDRANSFAAAEGRITHRLV
jgi:hypothetical protein